MYFLFSGRLPGALAGLLEEGEGVVPRKYIMSEVVYHIIGIILQTISESSTEEADWYLLQSEFDQIYLGREYFMVLVKWSDRK